MKRGITGLALLLLLSLSVSFCVTRLAEVDFHWHLLTGERILDGGGIPHVDDYSYTSAGREWIDLHWLFQVLVAIVHRLGGPVFLDLLKISLILCGLICAGAAALRRASLWPTMMVALLAIVAAQERFALRPEAASFLMLGLLLYCLERRRSSSRWLLVVPVLMALWANLHALYAVGIAVLGMTLLGDLLEHRWPGGMVVARDGPIRAGRLALSAAAGLLATLCTPYGFAGWRLPYRLLFERIGADNIYTRRIAEFQSPFSGYGTTASIIAFVLLATLVLLAAAIEWRRSRPADLLLLVAFFALALMARRTIALFAVVALAVGSPAVDSFVRRCQIRATGAPGWIASGVSAVSRLTKVVVVFSMLFLLVGVWSNRFYARDAIHRQFGGGRSPGHYPAGAAAFARETVLPGEVLNDMSMGGFLAWSWFPDRRVFIDGRLEVHRPELFADYLALQRDPEYFERIAREYGISTVLWSHTRSPEAAPLLRYLTSDSGWRPVYVDLAGAVFVRDDPGAPSGSNLPVLDLDDPAMAQRILQQIRKEERAAIGNDPAPAFLRRILPMKVMPLSEVNVALFFAVTGHWAMSETFFREAITRSPDNAALHHQLGLVLEMVGRTGEAREAFETAVRLDPELAPAREALAHVRVRDGDVRGALEEWRLAERYGSLGSGSLKTRGALLARIGRVDEAIRDYRDAVRLDPMRADLRADLAIVLAQRGLGEQARAEIRRALAVRPHACEPRVALGRIREAEFDAEGAEEAYREAIAIDDDCADARLRLAVLLTGAGRIEEAITEAGRAVASGLDPGVLSSDPSFRILMGRPEFRGLLEGRPEPSPAEKR